MKRDFRAQLGPHLLRLITRLSVLGGLSFGVTSWLTACQPSDAVECSTAAECASGQQCVNSQCLPGTVGAAGAAGATSVGGAHSASGGPGSGGMSNAGSSSATSNGGQSVGGASSVAGAPSTGGNGQAGGSGGQTASGGSAGSGNAGSGGMSVPADVVGKCKEDYWPATSSGSVTRYDFIQGTSLPACAHAITHKGAGRDGDWDTVEGISTGDGGYFGAMNTADFNKGAACGACAEITYNGNKKVVVTIVDECPIGSNSLCVKGHIDLSRKAIRQLQSNTQLEHLGKGGDGSISWRYVTCPASGNAQIRLHPNQNSDWQPVVIENGLYPLDKVTINGVDASRVGNPSGGNAWLAMGTKLPFAVRATDISGDTIQTDFNGGPALKDIGKQFMCNK